MDLKSWSVVYLDRRAREPRTFTNDNPPSCAHVDITASDQSLSPAEEVDANVKIMLATFDHVFVYTQGENCSACIKAIDHYPGEDTYTLLVIHIPHNDRLQDSDDVGPTEMIPLYGARFLSHIVEELQSQNKSGVVLPIVLGDRNTSNKQEPPDSWRDEMRILGALDVILSPVALPLSGTHLQVLLERADAIFRRPRKGEYAIMTRDLISKLMSDMAGYTHYEKAIVPRLHTKDDHIDTLVRTMGTWDFSAHKYSGDELVHGAVLMLKHVLKHPELEQWRISEDEILKYVSVTRRAYNATVIYHNFRHACDVLQAVFCFLISIGAIPPFPHKGKEDISPPCPLASLIQPVDALTLLISAIGHDVGHPGVNNVFLVKVKAAVAQVYNDHSVLESYHCAASSQILRRFWPAVFADTAMRKLMISSILATDMTLHGQYTARLDDLRKKYSQSGRSPKDENEKTQEEIRELLCCLIMKGADICNVARRFDIARDWAWLVTNEFAEQGKMEEDAQIPSCLFGGPPDPTNQPDMAKRQIGFMDIFAYDLFAKISDVLPTMHYTVDNIRENRKLWQNRLDGHKEPVEGQPFDTPADGRQNTGASVKPAQPQEIPDHDFETQQGFPPQPQTSRPSQPLEVPQEEEEGHGNLSPTGVAPHSRVDGSDAQQRRSSSKSSTASSTRKLKESHSRKASGVFTTQASQLVNTSKEPRRSSLGNITPPQSKDGSSRRSSGRSSTSGVVVTTSIAQDLPNIFTSSLRIGVSDSIMLFGDAANDLSTTPTSHRAHFEFISPWDVPLTEDITDRDFKRLKLDTISSTETLVNEVNDRGLLTPSRPGAGTDPIDQPSKHKCQ